MSIYVFIVSSDILMERWKRLVLLTLEYRNVVKKEHRFKVWLFIIYYKRVRSKTWFFLIQKTQLYKRSVTIQNVAYLENILRKITTFTLEKFLNSIKNFQTIFRTQVHKFILKTYPLHSKFQSIKYKPATFTKKILNT